MIKIAVISPHAPILLPDVGSVDDHIKVQATIESLKILGEKIKELKIDEIIISSPHEDWGFEVPLFFLASDFKGKIIRYLTGFESPEKHLELGKEMACKLEVGKNYALIASGDLSHVLLAEGPYGYHSDGPKFDQELVGLLEEKKYGEILKLDDKYPKAADCGLRSFAFALGLLQESGAELDPKILSYEGPFGVGYLVAQIA